MDEHSIFMLWLIKSCLALKVFLVLFSLAGLATGILAVFIPKETLCFNGLTVSTTWKVIKWTIIGSLIGLLISCFLPGSEILDLYRGAL